MRPPFFSFRLAEKKRTRRAWDCELPLPVAEEGGSQSPQPRLWRAVAKQARERHFGKAE
jgi:hypothetical protein